MSTPAQEGILSFGMQASRDVLPTVWYRHRADDVDLDIVQPMNTLPPEVGNDPVPTGTYKVGAFVGGGGTISPRMKKTFGYLLKGLMGDVATTADPPVTPTNWSHVFKFASGPTSLPWMGFRKLVPGSATLGLIGQGCKINSMRFIVPQGGILQARVDVIGRLPTFPEAPAWTYDAAMEDDLSLVISTVLNGFVKLPTYSANALPFTSLAVNMVNNINPFQRELIIGSPYMDDIIPLTRAMSIEGVVKWTNPDLYQAINGGTVSATAWAQACFYTDFQAKILSANEVVATKPFSFQIDAAKVAWTQNGPIRLVGAGELEMRLMGTVLKPNTGEYATLTILNDNASYA